jgi:Recombination endonuclease VII
MDTKWCNVCQQHLSVDLFNKDGRRRTGLATRCRTCDRLKDEKYRTRLALSPVPPAEEKTCGGCGRTLAGKEFGRDAQRPDGLQSTCKLCKKASMRFSRYGITREETIRLLEVQENLCALCRGPFGAKGFHVDHCHSGGQVRGLLCFHCNTGLGMFKDDPHRLQAAIDYLK